MKVIAMYLPQFHRVPENDMWWGEGFTEWTAVRGAQKYYLEHRQPRIPQNENYYDLMDKNTMIWQSELMKKYVVDGLCIYHYWFRDGRQILEKPANNLLNWSDIDIPFCFCWANETWARSWSKIQDKNVWADTYEEGMAGDGILLEQKYGREKQWEEHFTYLLPFFMDKRYIKVDGKPLFLIYKASEIFCLNEMIACWEELALLHGLPGIYLVGYKENISEDSCICAKMQHQPTKSMREIPLSWKRSIEGMNLLEYDDMWNYILAEPAEGKTFFEGVVGFDDTPRRGMKGCVVAHATPEKFSYYLTELLAKSEAYGADLVFINAWNEWGEGMYLEPDEEHGDKYLKAVLYAKKNYKYRLAKYKAILESDIKEGRQKNVRIQKIEKKDSYYLHLLDDWLVLREKGFSVAEWIRQAGYKKIAVYGYGILGRHLCKELHNSNVIIDFIIDRRGESIETDYKVYLPTDTFPEIEAVIVSAVFEYESICKEMRKKGKYKMISLETILYENDLR